MPPRIPTMFRCPIPAIPCEKADSVVVVNRDAVFRRLGLKSPAQRSMSLGLGASARPSPRSQKPVKFAIGQPLKRYEDQRLLTGKGRYTDDIALPGMVFAPVSRSP